MRSLLSLLACVGAVTARSFRDTSPFVFFTTHKALPSFSSIASSESIYSSVTSELSECHSDVYVLAHQRGVSADDFEGDDITVLGLKTKWLSGHDKRVAGSIEVAQAVGDHLYSADQRFHDTLTSKCGAALTVVDPHSAAVIEMTDAANITKPRIVSVELPQIHAGEGDMEERRRAWRQHELALNRIIELYTAASPHKFSVLLTTSPPVFATEHGSSAAPEQKGFLDEEDYVSYAMEDMQDPLANMELKRDITQHEGLIARASGNSTSSKAPLFEKYQYFTPGLFMGLTVGIMLLLILYVAISGLSSLTVSYAAFEKEMGPQAQRKQQ